MNPDEPVRAMLIPLSDGAGGSAIRLSDLVAETRKRWLAIVVFGVVCLVAALVVYATADVKYRASTTFILSSQAQGPAGLGALGAQLGGLANFAGLSLPDSTGMREEALATLQSRSLVSAFIAEQDLIPVLYANKLVDEGNRWDTESGEAPTNSQATRFFRENVMEIDRDPGANTVKLSITWTDPALAAAWANDLVKRVDNGLRERAKREARQSIEFLETELQTSSNSDLQSAMFTLIEQNMATVMMANVRPDFAFRMIDPAVIPEADERVWPRLIYIVAAAGFVWLVLSGALVLIFALRADNRTNTESTD